MKILDGRKKVSRQQVMEAIQSGQYTMIVGGREVTDFTKINEMLGAWPKPAPKVSKGQSQVQRLMVKFQSRCHFCRRICDRDSPTNRPVRDWLVNSTTHKNRFSNLVLACFSCFNRRHPPANPPPRATTVVNIGDGREFKAQRLEHLGDAIILIAARQLSHERFGKENSAYCHFAIDLVTNRNLATYPGIKNADQFEIIIGQEFVRDGIEVAFDTAKEMLKQTKSFQENDQ